MIRPLIVIIIVILLILLARWIARQPQGKRWQIITVAIAVILVGLAVTGRLHWIIAAAGAALPFMRRIFSLLSYWPLINRLRGKTNNGESGSSTFETAYLRVSVNLSARQMSGEVIKGEFSGQPLNSLSKAQMDALKCELRQNDAESYALLLAYLQFRGSNGSQSDDNQSANYRPGTLSRQEAYAILGLQDGASKEDIIAAHRRLIQKLHPDRGGSSYLASKINQAKDTLLK